MVNHHMRWYVWLILVVLLSGSWLTKAWGAEPVDNTSTAQTEEEVVTPKPLEKPPEVPLYLPGVTPAMPYLPYVPYNNLQPGTQTGIFAPYGASNAQDTLRRGWQRHHLGPVGVNPYFEYDTVYRTNIFQTNTDKKADFINTLNPGIRFELPVAQQHKLSLGYLGNYYIYSRYGSQTHFDHNINADGTFNFNRLSLRCGLTFRAAAEEANAETLRQRYYYLATPYLETVYGASDRWKIAADYQYGALRFGKSINNIDDSQDHILGLTVFYKFLPKTSALLQYIADIRLHPYSNIQNNVVHTPYIGVTWDPTAKLNGTIKFGYSFNQYANNVPGQNSSPTSWSLSVQTNYRYNSFTNIILVAQRSFQEDADNANASYINSGVTAGLTHYFHYFKVSSYLTLSYNNNNYINNLSSITGPSTQGRTDNYFTIGCGLSRPVTPWLRLRLDYLYNDKSSNVAGFTFNEHWVILGIQSSF